MNDQNLKPFKTGEARAVEAGRKGGIASGEVRRESTRALLLAELDKPHMVSNTDEDGMFTLDFSEKPAGYSRRVAMVKRLVSMAVLGDLKAVKLVLDLTEGDGAGAGDPSLEA